jgi:hypothetical protein
MLTQEQVEITNKVLQGVLANPPTATLTGEGEDAQIVVGEFTISEAYSEGSDGSGFVVQKNVFVLDVSVPTGGTRHEPPGVDVVELATLAGFHNVVAELVNQIAQVRVTIMLDDLATDAQVKQMEEDAELAGGTFMRNYPDE